MSRLQAVGDKVRQGPEADPRQDEGYRRRRHRLLDGLERVLLEGARHRDVDRVPQRAPEELVGDDLWHGNPPAEKKRRIGVVFGRKIQVSYTEIVSFLREKLDKQHRPSSQIFVNR